MASDDPGESPARPKKARKSVPANPALDLGALPSPQTPTDRIIALCRERSDALELDKADLAAQVETLRVVIDRLSPENARLRESLSNAQANNTVSLIVVTIGSGIVGLASFLGPAAQRTAFAGSGVLLTGVILMIITGIRSWRAKA